MLSRRAALARAWPWLVLAALAILCGLWLRIWQLHAQVLIDDEWHAVRMLIGSNAAGIATHFGFADYCIPLTLYYRWLYDLGALSEWQMHLPPLVAGVALLAVAPMMLRDRVAWPARAIWIALLSISPVLVYLSRTARPYTLACLCAFVAIVAFERWRRTRSSLFAATYVVTAVFAAWLHLLTIVFTLWPFVWFGVPALIATARARTRDAGAREIGRLVLLAVATIAGLALVLGPPLLGDWRAMAAKAGSGQVTLDTLYRSMLMMFGVANAFWGVVLALVAVFGVATLWRRDRDFVAYVVSTIVIGMIAITLSHAAWVQHQQTFVRYALPTLPFVLLFIAEGLAAIVGALRWPALSATAAAIMLLAIALAGPLRSYYYAPNQLMGHELFQFDYARDANPFATKLVLGPVPAFYRNLATRPPGSITLIETPARLMSDLLPDPWYQAIHRQNVKFALAAPVCGGEADEFPYTATGTRFRGVGKLGDILDGATWGADYLVLRMHAWSVPPGEATPWPDMQACATKVGERLGEPVYRDDQIVVFALAKK